MDANLKLTADTFSTPDSVSLASSSRFCRTNSRIICLSSNPGKLYGLQSHLRATWLNHDNQNKASNRPFLCEEPIEPLNPIMISVDNIYWYLLICTQTSAVLLFLSLSLDSISMPFLVNAPSLCIGIFTLVPNHNKNSFQVDRSWSKLIEVDRSWSKYRYGSKPNDKPLHQGSGTP